MLRYSYTFREEEEVKFGGISVQLVRFCVEFNRTIDGDDTDGRKDPARNAYDELKSGYENYPLSFGKDVLFGCPRTLVKLGKNSIGYVLSQVKGNLSAPLLKDFWLVEAVRTFTLTCSVCCNDVQGFSELMCATTNQSGIPRSRSL